MIPAAHTQACIDVVQSLLEAWDSGRALPADGALNYYLRNRRYIGSGDRRAITARFYALLRRWGVVQWALDHVGAEPTARLLVLAADPSCAVHFGQGTYGPAPLDEAEQRALARWDLSHAPAWAHANMPEWLHDRIADCYGDHTDRLCQSLQAEAPLVLRVNLLKANRDNVLSELRREGIDAQATAHSPWGIELQQRVALGNLAAYREGRVEVQDEGSQLAVLACDVKPGMRVIDLCAGAGGKSLALAAAMRNMGELLAVDIEEARLQEAQARAQRAGVTCLQTHCDDATSAALPRAWHGTADVVLVDAPCTGTGTLRRNPDLAWRIAPETIEQMHATQVALMTQALPLLKPHGRMIYTTCSVLKEENYDSITQVLTKKIARRLALEGQMWDKQSTLNGSEHLDGQLLPSTHGTDGFYIAALAARYEES